MSKINEDEHTRSCSREVILVVVVVHNDDDNFGNTSYSNL